MSDLSFTRGLKLSLAAAAMLMGVGLGSAADAAIVNTGTCSYSTDLLSSNLGDTPNYMSAGVSAAINCGSFSTGQGGNTTDAMLNTKKAFGQEGWGLLGDVINLPELSNIYLGIVVLSVKPDPKGDEPIGGTWSLLDGHTFAEGGYYALTLKGGPKSLTYLLDTAFTAGTWSMKDLGGKGLSNLRLFGTEGPFIDPRDPGVVPLPAAAWLMFAGIGGLGLVARRRKARAV